MKPRIEKTSVLLLVTAGLLTLPAAAPAQEFEWRGVIERGHRIEIKGIKGEIRATAAPGSEAVVRATKMGRRDDPADVRIEVVEHEDGVTICTVYPSSGGRKNECAPGRKGHLNAKNNDVQVFFAVEVPAGIELVGSMINGDVTVRGLGGDVRASSVNGDVDVEASGVVRASTVNGSVRATMGRADWSGKIELKSVNGSITAVLPADASAVVSASTVNGAIQTDFPLEVRGRFASRRLRGTIGSGGRELALETVNGSIRLEKGE